MASMLDTAPQAGVWGAASNTETVPCSPIDTIGTALTRASQPDYAGWLEHVRAAAGCTRPIRLTGTLHAVDTATGAVLDARHTDQLPDSVIYKACGNRRATVCPSCAQTYQRDAFEVLRIGLVGGKGVPGSVARHPAVFLTLTAPGFGTVHTRHVGKHTCASRRRCDCRPDPCHARREVPLCDHGRPAVCWARHPADDPALGRPLCLDCYDHDHQAVFNVHAAELWHRTKQAAERLLATRARMLGVRFRRVITPSGKVRYVPPVRLAHGKAAEMQRRGVVHFHALIRLDGVNPQDAAAVIPPPTGIGVDDLVDALSTAARTVGFDTPAHPDRPAGWPMGWGEQLDVRPLTLGGSGEVTDAMAAGYLAKYATKSTEATGHSSARLTEATVGDYADPDGDHLARLIEACWRLGRPDREPVPLSERPAPPGPEPGERRTPFDTPWTCPHCGIRTRYAVCLCQDLLDIKSASRRSATGYHRLRRWAHMLGYGGHFLTKGRRYSVTFQLLRDTRVAFRRQSTDSAPAGRNLALDLDQAATVLVGALTYAGAGWHTFGDALLANTAAALARERQQAGREELAHEAGSSVGNLRSAA